MNKPSVAYGSLGTGTYPSFAAKNASASTATDGFPFTKTFVDDIMGAFEAILNAGGFTTEASLSGNSETYSASDILTALRQGAGQPPGRLVLFWGSDTEMGAQHLLECTGQTLTQAAYPGLFAALDAAFITGTDFTLPNLAGLFPQGRGSQTFTFTDGDGVTTRSGTFAGPALAVKSGDQIRNITGVYEIGVNGEPIGYSGALSVYNMTMGSPAISTTDNGGRRGFDFYASRVVPTGPVNKPGSFSAKICITY
ncbi:hypothetical protein FACS189479_05610 [Spirochaetia bacterium]|nr:hypothetical protein FACS189479_05610 [Spirochaetia bacterium]